MGRRPWGPWRTLPCPSASTEAPEAPAWPRVGPRVRVGGCVMPVICHPVLGQPTTRVARRIDHDGDDSLTANCAFRGESEVVFLYPYITIPVIYWLLTVAAASASEAPRDTVPPLPPFTCAALAHLPAAAEKLKTLFFQMLCLMFGEGEGGLLNWLPLCSLRPECLLLEPLSLFPSTLRGPVSSPWSLASF